LKSKKHLIKNKSRKDLLRALGSDHDDESSEKKGRYDSEKED